MFIVHDTFKLLSRLDLCADLDGISHIIAHSSVSSLAQTSTNPMRRAHGREDSAKAARDFIAAGPVGAEDLGVKKCPVLL